MNLLDQLFGSGQQMYNPHQQLNSWTGSSGSLQAQSQADLYNQQILRNAQKQMADWVYNGRVCSLNEFTELMWPDDEQARLMFILKHGGVK